MLRNAPLNSSHAGKLVLLAAAFSFILLLAATNATTYADELAMPVAQPCNCTSKERESELKAKMKSAEKQFGSYSKQYIQSLLDLSDLYAHKGNVTVADALLKEAEDDCNVMKNRTDQAAEVQIQRSRIAIDQHSYARAEKYAAHAVELSDLVRSNNKKARALSTLAWAQAEQRKFTAARANYDKSWSLRARTNSVNDEEAAFQLLQMGSLADKLGETDKSITDFEKSLSLLVKLHSTKHPHAEFVREQLADKYMRKQKYDRAAALLKTVITDKESVFGTDSPQLLSPLYQYSLALQKLGQTKESDAARQRAVDISTLLQEKAKKGQSIP